MRFRRIAPVVVLVGAACLAASPPSPAHAATASGLPITSVYQVLADTAHGHVYISQGPDAGAGAPIVVTNLSGAPIAAIGDGARGMALSANDETLYAAIGDTVTAYSTTTLKQTASYPTPGLAWQVAVQSGRLWVSYQDAADDTGRVGGIDLTDPAAPWDPVPTQWLSHAPAIATDPGDSGVLVASGANGFAGAPPAASYDVAGLSAVTMIASATSVYCAADNLAVFPGGKTFLCGSYTYSTATMAPTTTVPAYSGFLALAPNGAIAAGTDEGILAYPANATTASAEYDEFYGVPLPPNFSVSASFPAGFAWSANSEELFTIIESQGFPGNPVYTMLPLYPFERVPADVTLTSTAPAIPYDGSFAVTLHLGVTDGNRTFSIYRTIAGKPRQMVVTCTCNGWSDSYTVTSSSWTTNTTYTGVFTGDARYEPTTVTLAIKVAAKVAAALSGSYKTATVGGLRYRFYHRNATLEDSATVTPDKQGECVRLQVQRSARGSWRADATTGCVALNKRSQAAIARKLATAGWFRVRADFTPSARDTANVGADSSWLYYVVPS